MSMAADKYSVYVGTYSTGERGGIFVYSLDTTSGALQPVSVVSGDTNPSFLALHPAGGHLYAVNEAEAGSAPAGGAVSSYAIDAGGERLTLLNRQPTLGKGPCHIHIDYAGRYAFVSNYGGGSLTVLPVNADGSLGYPSDYIQHQEVSDAAGLHTPHVHSAGQDPTGHLLFVADLGLDRIMTYLLDVEQGVLTPHAAPWVNCRPASGPRHFTFHPNGRLLYVINELDSTISVFNYDPESGICRECQTVSALPVDFADKSWCADIHLRPDGRFLYGSNRGHDSLVIFAVDGATGLLSYINHVGTGGKWPRNFALDPAGRLLLVANQHSDSIVSYWIDAETGMLQPTGHTAAAPQPACVLIRP